MKLVLISDTHTFHSKISVPDGDVLVHAGDMGLEGNVYEIQSCLDWLNDQPHKHIVAIAGNHDWAFAKKHPLNLGRVLYLENSGISIDKKNFWGSPVQPEFCNWAFNVPRGPKIRKFWNMIPSNTDVLITHGPPRGIGDQSDPKRHSQCLGCADLFEVVEKINPKVHVFGHIHGGYGKTQFGSGTIFVNASICDEAYCPVNKPWEIEV